MNNTVIEEWHWSRAPGRFVNLYTGLDVFAASALAPGPVFAGTVREWYETLTETVLLGIEKLREKTGVRPKMLEVSPYVYNILAMTTGVVPSSSQMMQEDTTDSRELVATFYNQYQVFRNNNLPKDCLRIISELPGNRGYRDNGLETKELTIHVLDL